MKNKSTLKGGKQEARTKTNHTRWIIGVSISLVVIMALYSYWPKSQDNSSGKTSKAPSVSNSTAPEIQDRLPGRWTRTDSDGAYIIEIRSASADGILDARYFNLNPINVWSAAWQKNDGRLTVVVELQDVNYPGSTYTLNFIPAEDRMASKYYQAMQGINYDVEFVRMP